VTYAFPTDVAFSCLLTRDKVSKLKRRAPRKHVPSRIVLRKQRNEVPETAEQRFVLNFVIDRRAARQVP
jgi:hypothetical protein